MGRKRRAEDAMTGDRVREIRRLAGLNQSEFWSRIGVTQSGGSRYESGRSIPKPVRLLLTLAYGSGAESAAALSNLRRPRSDSGSADGAHSGG